MERLRIAAWSALSGLLWALAWPGIGGMAWLAFVAWLPLFHAERLHDQRTAGRKRAFVPYALIGLFFWNALTSWWFFMVSEPLSTRLVSGLAPMVVNTLLMALPWWLRRVVHKWSDVHLAGWAFVAFWMSFERLHHAWDLQWPWFSLGNVFAGHPVWIQWYEWTGMMGGTLWVLLLNLHFDRMVKGWRSRALVHNVIRIVPPFVLVMLPIVLSMWRFNHYRFERGVPVEVVVVQPNVDPYSEKFGGVDPLDQLDRMLQQAENVVTDSTVLLVLPETALQENATVDLHGIRPVLNGLWENDLERSRSAQRIRAFQQEHPRVSVLSGMSSAYLFPTNASDLPVTARPIGGTDLYYEAYNAAIYLVPDTAVQHYHKSKLVAGVELMPFESVLGPLSALSVDLGGTTGSLGQQKERAVLHYGDAGLRIVPAICYESVFGEHVAAHVRNGGNLIAIMTNDGWWADSPGYRQHLTFATIRAIETRRSIVRSANTGISCMVDQRGVIHQRTEWWRPDAFRTTVYLNEDLTFFVRYGDLLGHAAAMVALILLVFAAVQRRRALA
ncbi:MAG: apolipoprotein N-acyltransferase [Flavobacteriales bacterium]|nr:apolipoprotein N-acyltransferase [Flavobacteriales bacterium]